MPVLFYVIHRWSFLGIVTKDTFNTNKKYLELDVLLSFLINSNFFLIKISMKIRNSNFIDQCLVSTPIGFDVKSDDI